MDKRKNIPYYIAAISLFILLKFSFTIADTRHLFFLLKPIDGLIGLLMGSVSVFRDGGFYHEKLNIIIDKSCSGFNFWVLSFLLFTYLFLEYVDRPWQRRWIIPIALVFSYCLTIFTNTSRIYTSIIIQHYTEIILANYQDVIHEAIGVVTNLSFLILTYIFIEKKLKQIKSNERLA